jgi:glycosyltransferase involved in cell wall biosynthesis
LLKVVRQVRPDLIQATLFRSRMTARAVAAWTGIPLIETFVNDDYGRERRATFSRAGRVRLDAVRRFDAATARVAVHNIAVSCTVRDAMCEALGVDKERCSVIYRGRDPSKYASRKQPEASTTRASLDLAPDARLLLAVGRLVPAKDHATLLRAMPSVLSAHPEVRLFVAGGGPLEAELQADIARLGLGGRVTLLGTRSDVPALLRAADMFVFPSRYEGHAGALVEAMFAGLPIVAADTSVHRESVQHGVSGILATPGDPESFSIGILRHLDSPEAAAAMGRAARGVALERFDVERIAAQHEECYRRVLARS